MSRIVVLDPNMVNMIAAGEVIERPASVVKELMENSLDAGATSIRVDVEDGGRRLIAVTDDGGGMDAEDLGKAFLTHATSKIRSCDDLRHIATMGFRGEALASIASVAQVRAVTRQRGQDEALCLEIDCGRFQPIVPASLDVGTRIEVRDLFYRLPARRKFLRTAQTEFGHVVEQFTRIALGACRRPGPEGQWVSDHQLVLSHNGREVHRLPGGQRLEDRVVSLFPSLSDVSSAGPIAVDSEEGPVRLHGLLGPPGWSRSNGRWQYVFLNGRFIRDKLISHAIKEAYRCLLEPNRYPVVFLYLEMPLEDYDVNVHPTKVEVRFYRANRVHSQVLGALRERLLAADLNVHAKLPAADSWNGSEGSIPRRREVTEAIEGFLKSHRPRPEAPRFDFKPAAPGPPAFSRASDVAEPAVGLEVSVPRRTTAQGPARALQIHDAYLVVQTEEGFEIIDQHALHEKILYEQLAQRVEKGLTAQRLLLPVEVQLEADQAAALEQQRRWLDRLGIELTRTGPDRYAVASFPVLLEHAEPGEFVRDLADILAAGQTVDAEKLTHDIFSMAACKAAIKAGDPLTPAEIEQLLEDGRRARSATRCPHGRPTTIKFTLAQLARQFLRT